VKRLATLVLGLLVLACGNGSHPSAAKPTPTATPGRPAPAIVQVEDDRLSRPQSGLQSADMVFEYLTEGGITRFSVIFFSPQGADKLEPIRSARLVTLRLVHGYGGVLFYSGASNRVQGQINNEGLPAINEFTDGGKFFSRDHSRQAPYNLYTSTDRLRDGVAKFNKRVTYELPPTGPPPAGGQPVASLSFQQTDVHHVALTWSAADAAYTYKDEIGQLIDTDRGGAPVKIANVVLVRVAHHDAGYTEDVLGENGIDFDLSGTGPADVYSAGQHWQATWNFDGASPLQLTGADGKPFPLAKGLTWYSLIDPSTTVGG
jgi:hypothetical protein